jgi:acyl-CoA thioester hydrolase
MCPVIRMNFRFIKATRYDEQLTVKTTLKAIKGVRIWFEYKLFNEQNELINEAGTELAFVGRDNWKPCTAPDFLVSAIAKHSVSGLIHK